MSISWSRTPDMTNWWKCSECGREVDHSFYGDNCPDCGHVKCGDCGSVAPPISPIPDGYCGHTCHGSYQYEFQTHSSPNINAHGCQEYPIIADLFGTGQQETSPNQIMVGWWQCCQCGREVKTELYGEDCPDCGHVKDDYCSNLG